MLSECPPNVVDQGHTREPGGPARVTDVTLAIERMWTTDNVRVAPVYRRGDTTSVDEWCRRADSNRRPRAYETRALTN